MDTVSIIVVGFLGLACWLACRFIPQMLSGKKNHARAQFGGKNDRPPRRHMPIPGNTGSYEL